MKNWRKGGEKAEKAEEAEEAKRAEEAKDLAVGMTPLPIPIAPCSLPIAHTSHGLTLSRSHTSPDPLSPDNDQGIAPHATHPSTHDARG